MPEPALEAALYVSCEWIESRVVLEQTKLKFCCIGHSGHKGYVPMCDYDGGEIPEAEVRAARKKLIQENNTPGVETGCTGCHFLETRDWDKERKSAKLFDTVYVANFSICNLSCRYCFVYLSEFTEVSNVVGYPLLPVFQRLIEGGHLAEGGKVEWGGGEPTIVPGFAEIMRLLMRNNYYQQIHTSSVKFSPELEEALRLGKAQAVTSVDAGTRETYKAVKGRDRFDIVWENVGKYAASGGKMALKYILRHNNSDEANIQGFIARAKAVGIKEIVLTPDFREIAQQQITERTIYAFARMVQEAKRAGIPIAIRDEYLNPEQMRRVSKYIPLQTKAWRYHLHLALVAGRERLQRLAEGVRARLRAGEREQTLARAQDLLDRENELVHPLQLLQAAEDTDARILDLLERQTREPDTELRTRLTEAVARRFPIQATPTILNVAPDAFTTDGKPGYVVLDARSSEKPVKLDMWFTCWAKSADYPIRVTISDGVADDIEFTYTEAQRLRVPLPEVPPGESRIYSVKTDKTWRLPSGDDPRPLGVQITTSI